MIVNNFVTYRYNVTLYEYLWYDFTFAAAA